MKLHATTILYNCHLRDLEFKRIVCRDCQYLI